MYGKFRDCNCINNNSISIKKLEELVWKSLYDFIVKSDKIKKEYKLRYKNKLGEKDRFSGKLKYYKTELSNEEEKKMKMVDKWLDGKISDDDKERWEVRNKITIEKIKKSIKELEYEVDRLETFSNVDNYVTLMKKDLKSELKVRRFEDKRRVIEKYVENVSVKYISGSGKVKEYEIGVKLFYDGGDDGDGLFKMLYKTINNVFYIPKNNLAQTNIHTYNSHYFRIDISLTYKYTIINVGKNLYNKFKNKRELIKVF